MERGLTAADGIAFSRQSKQLWFVEKRRACVNDRTQLSVFDMVIVAICASAALFPFVLVISGRAIPEWLEVHRWWINVASIATATTLLAWMFFGGKNSPLWRFFRPPDVMWIRWVAVIGVFVAAITGAFVRP